MAFREDDETFNDHNERQTLHCIAAHKIRQGNKAIVFGHFSCMQQEGTTQPA